MDKAKCILNLNTIIPSLTPKAIARHNYSGICIIWRDTTPLYLTTAQNINQEISKIFQVSGVLSHIDIKETEIEILKTSIPQKLVVQTLINHLTPKYNTQCSYYNTKQQQEITAKIKKQYQKQSTPKTAGNHQSDTKPLLKIKTIHPPKQERDLAKYRAETGIYIIWKNDNPLFIGSSTNLYKGIIRMFQKSGNLAHINIENTQIEIIATDLTYHTVENVLKRHLEPQYNKRVQKVKISTNRQKSHYQKIIESYILQSQIIHQGEHKSDS